MDYFQGLFTTPEHRGDMNFLGGLEERVSDVMNHNLTLNFIEEKVSIALQQMNPTKAPGLDGMAPIFYQKYWHVVGRLVTVAAFKAFNTG